MKLNCQAELFDLQKDVTFLNCAAYSPLLKSVQEAGINGIKLKARPYNIFPKEHFFDKPAILRNSITNLIHCKESDRIALIPSVSYGLAIVAKNLRNLLDSKSKKSILIIDSEFPNNTYTFESLGFEVNSLSCDIYTESWNEIILGAINTDVAALIVPHVHWIYGYTFDLEQIAKACKAAGTLLIIDGTQSVGALTIDIEKIKPDALICGAYKWMLGPYSSGFGYFGEIFDNGTPLEETWMNRVESDNFSFLLNYQDQYRPMAQRYNMGEFSNFINTPMLQASVGQILSWGVDHIQEYCRGLMHPFIKQVQALGCEVLDLQSHASHLVSIKLPKQLDKQKVMSEILKAKVHISLRGDCLRISPHVYNNAEDLENLFKTIKFTFNK